MNRQLRIIGGKWRGRKVNFPEHPDLRPTTDRVRETLFNWLMHDIHDARCLDLFAGSGAIGIEALSRGAAHVDFVDSDDQVLNAISSTLNQFGSSEHSVITQDAIDFLSRVDQPYDLVFLDPPFGSELLIPVLSQIATSGLASRFIYVETPTEFSLDLLPKSWVIHRQKQAGQCHYALLQRDIPSV